MVSHQEAPAEPGHFVSVPGEQEVYWVEVDASGQGRTKYLVPTSVDCTLCGCMEDDITDVSESTLQAMPTSQTAFNCSMVPRPMRNPEAGGRFITAGGTVWYESPVDSADGRKRYEVPAVQDCSQCGCQRVVHVEQSVIDAIPEAGADFSCDLVLRPPGQHAEVPFQDRMNHQHGRFITGGKHVWWQAQPGGMKHLVPPSQDCSECGCNDKIMHINQTEIAAMPRGDDFECEMRHMQLPADAEPFKWGLTCVSIYCFLPMCFLCYRWFFAPAGRRKRTFDRRLVGCSDGEEDSEASDEELARELKLDESPRSVDVGRPRGVDVGQPRAAGAGQPPRAAGAGRGSDLFDVFDHNHDGVIDRQEFAFGVVDRNHDGIIDRGELAQAVATRTWVPPAGLLQPPAATVAPWQAQAVLQPGVAPVAWRPQGATV